MFFNPITYFRRWEWTQLYRELDEIVTEDPDYENMIFVNPALIITEEQLREEMVKVDEVLTEVHSWLTI